MSDREVKTKQTFTEWWFKQVGTSGQWTSLENMAAHDAWNAALASVIQPEGRFEVGDRAVMEIDGGNWEGQIVFRPDSGGWVDSNGRNVHPLPRTVELTTEQKLNALFDKLHGDNPQALAWHTISVNLANANSEALDKLCSEFGVSTTKELS